MIGDAISHAVLPGIVIAYLVTETRASLVMLVGAALFGILTTVLIEWLSKRAKLQEAAAIGISFTWMFAIGIILNSAFSRSIDLDQYCELYGEIAFVPLDTWTIGSLPPTPRTVWVLGGLLILIVAFIVWAYKPLVMTSFDPVYAASAGISTAVWHYALMGFVSLNTVLSFDSVGAILGFAFLVVPADAADLLTNYLPQMILTAIGLGIVAAIGGYYLAVAIDGSIAGAMAVAIGIEFLLVLIYQKVFNPLRRHAKLNAIH